MHDSHIRRDRYDAIAGPADPAADLRLGVLHSPEPAVLDRFAADGFDLLLAGHTHGGQVCLPWLGTLVTNCGIDRAAGARAAPASGGSGRETRTALAARFRWPRHLAVGASQVQLPAGGHAAHASSADQLDCSRGRRGVAQLGSALRSGRRGRGFKSRHPDQVRGHLRSLQVAFPVR